MSSLKTQHCLPCEGGVEKISAEEARDILTKEIPSWQLNETTTEISKIFKFKNYYETIAFVNAIAWLAHQDNHHPDLVVSYNQCIVRYSTHAINGLSTNDFICAAKVDGLLLD